MVFKEFNKTHHCLKTAFILLLLVVVFFMILPRCVKDKNSIERGKEITLRLKPSEGNPRNSEGDFIQLKDGKILFIYTHFTAGSGDHANAYLCGRFSSDGGRNWTKDDVVILPNEGEMNIMSVSLLRLADSSIALFYLRKNSEKDCLPMMRISIDEAQTWSQAKPCVDFPGYFVLNNDRAVQLTKGRIILPLALHATDQSPWSEKAQILCFYSDDNGRSWSRSQFASNPEAITLQEPGVVQLTNGKLLMFCRTDVGAQFFSYSSDNGETWSDFQMGNIKSPMSPASIERIPKTGDLLVVWNNNYEPGEKGGGKRTPLNLALSHDDGKNWEIIKTLQNDPDGWYCYTAIEWLTDHILLGYCAGNRKKASGLETTFIARLDYGWIYRD